MKMEICSGTGHMGEQEVILITRFLKGAEDEETWVAFLNSLSEKQNHREWVSLFQFRIKNSTKTL